MVQQLFFVLTYFITLPVPGYPPMPPMPPPIPPGGIGGAFILVAEIMSSILRIMDAASFADLIICFLTERGSKMFAFDMS